MEEEPKEIPPSLSLKEYLALQIEEMHSPENKWFAGEKFGHPPTDKEAEMYYVENGGATGFAERHLLKARMDKEKEEKKKTENENQ
jgi:hypothetical protein